MESEYYSVCIRGHWRVVNTCLVPGGIGLLKHLSEKTARSRCERASALERAGAISPADLISIRRNLILSRPEFAQKLRIAVRTLEDYEQAKRRISPVAYELAKRIGAENE